MEERFICSLLNLKSEIVRGSRYSPPSIYKNLSEEILLYICYCKRVLRNTYLKILQSLDLVASVCMATIGDAQIQRGKTDELYPYLPIVTHSERSDNEEVLQS